MQHMSENIKIKQEQRELVLEKKEFELHERECLLKINKENFEKTEKMFLESKQIVNESEK